MAPAAENDDPVNVDVNEAEETPPSEQVIQDDQAVASSSAPRRFKEEDGDDLPNFGDEDNEVDLQNYGQIKKRNASANDLDDAQWQFFGPLQNPDSVSIYRRIINDSNESNGTQTQTKAKRFTFRPNSRRKLLIVQYYRQHYKKLKHDWTPNHSNEDYFKEWKAYLAHVKR